MKVAAFVILSIFIVLSSKSQSLNFDKLFEGKWKYEDMPDSVKWFDSSLHLCPSNPSFWFKDDKHVDVVWNGFYFKDQEYIISKAKNLLFVYVDSIYDNVSGFACVFKPISAKHMKLQYCKFQKGDLIWNDNENWHNTENVYLFSFRPK